MFFPIPSTHTHIQTYIGYIDTYMVAVAETYAGFHILNACRILNFHAMPRLTTFSTLFT